MEAGRGFVTGPNVICTYEPAVTAVVKPVDPLPYTLMVSAFVLTEHVIGYI